jgi:hypothetical protein
MPLRCETLKKFPKKSDPANFFAPLLFSQQKQLTKEIVLLRKRSITIGLLITFLISLTTSELLAWHMIRKGDQSTVTPFHYTIYTPHREDVCIDDVGRPPKA